MLAIYSRTSKNKVEGTDYSIDTQQKAGLNLAQQLGLKHEFYTDEGLSGTLGLEGREAFAYMLKDIKKGKISAVYCFDQSRIERNTDVWRFFAGECIINKVKFYIENKQVDFTDADSMLGFNLISLINSYYATLTSKKVKLANAEKVKKGKTHGMKPYGFKRDHENNYAIVEEEALHVRRMFELSLSGVGTYTIANIFNEEKIPTKFNKFKGDITRKDSYTNKKILFSKANVLWRGNVIYDMLINPIYKGIRIWNKDNIDERIETNIGVTIIDPDMWDAVNENLVKNKKNVGKKADYNYLLNGLILCGHCGNEVLGKKRMKGHDNAYKCKGKRPPHKTCTESRGLSLPKLENFIIQHLFKSKSLEQLLLEAPRNVSEAKELSLQINKLVDEKILLDKAVLKLARLIQDPELEDDDNFLQEYKKKKNKRVTIDDQIKRLQEKKSEIEFEHRNERTKSIIQQYVSDISFDDIKRLVHSLIQNITLVHEKDSNGGKHSILIEYKYYDEMSVFSTNWQALKWHWDTFKRKIASNEEQRKEDEDILEGLFDLFDIKNNSKLDLIESIRKSNLLDSEAKDSLIESLEKNDGFGIVTFMNEELILNPNDLILFD